MQQLTAKQQTFAQEYLIDLNATQAAIRAGYSPKSAVCSGKRNMARDDIQTLIHEAMKARSVECTLTAKMVIDELSSIAFGEMKKGDRVSDKLRALELLGKHLGLFVDRHEITGEDSGPLVIVVQAPDVPTVDV